jgi:molybdopterin biosynthesis enzyme
MTTQRLSPSLTPLDVALAAWLRGLEPLAPVALPLTEASGCIAAEMPPLAAYPSRDIAVVDGWAVRAHDLVGASSYSPLPMATSPTWVEVGDQMPEGCDCVLDAAAVDASGPLVEVVAEATPGQGVRRAGSDIVAGFPAIAAGHPLRPRDLLIARLAGLARLHVRRPRLHIVNLPGGTATAGLIAESARLAGADVTEIEATARDAACIAGLLDVGDCDLLMTVGGSGVGRGDAAMAALARRGEVLAHGIALQPGRTAGLGRVAGVSVLALPGAPDQALAVWLALALPAVERLSGRRPRKAITLPLARKIASSVGISEIALLERQDGAWLPLAVGELPLQAVARAEAWLLVAAGSEGFAAGTSVDAYLWRE